MRTFSYHIAFSVAAWGCAASIPNPHAVGPSSQPLATPSPSLPGRDRVRDYLTDPLAKRGTVSCPEEIGGKPFLCASSFCGGEDRGNAGHCITKNPLGSQCRCVADGSTAAPVLSVVTATKSGQTVTGTYALETLSAYSGLRQSVTTTVTLTTTSNGVTGEKTAAAVVLAGGVSWFLTGFVGDTAVAEAVLEAPKTAEGGHEDDKACPNSKAKCSDCGGKGGMCTSGLAIGCGCDGSTCPTEHPFCDDPSCAGANDKCTTAKLSGCGCKGRCPTGDQKPSCSDKGCKGGTDNKCTIDHHGCDCQPNQQCPMYENTLFCEDCGGDANGKCNGLKDQNGRYKDCACLDSTPPGNLPYKHDDIDGAAVAAAYAALPDITEASYSDGPKPVCQKAGWDAPQRDQDGTPSVTSKINEWCAEMDGKTVTRQPDGVDTKFSMYRYRYYSFWLSASNWYYAPGENKCGKTVTISKNECVSSLTKAMITCDPNSGSTHGASLPGKCITYNITLSAETNPESPPWNPLPPSASPQCDTTKLSGVTNAFFGGLYPQFCSSVDGDKAKALQRVLTNDDFKAPAGKRWPDTGSLIARTPPASSKQYPDYKFHFDWTGSKGNCREDCASAFKAITNSPCGHQSGEQNGMTTKGSMDVGCGTYSYEIEAPLPVFCKRGETPPVGYHCEPNKGDCKTQPQVNPRSTFFAAALQYCNGGYYWTSKPDYKLDTPEPYTGKFPASNWFWFDSTSIDPATKLPPMCMGSIGNGAQLSPPSSKLCKKTTNGKPSDSRVVVQVSPSESQTGCRPLKDHKLPSGDECTKIFAKVIDKCIPEGNHDETGGFYTENSADGCYDWWIWGSNP